MTVFLFSEFCVFFATISNWPGHYPLDENISEAPQIFWNSLKDEFFLCSERKKYYLKVYFLKNENFQIFFSRLNLCFLEGT